MKNLLFSVLIILSANTVYAQMLYPEVMSCFGGHAQNQTLQLTWTAGEPMYETVSNNDNILTQGFNQTVYVSLVTDIVQIAGFDLRVYPNPTVSVVHIEILQPMPDNIELNLYDMNGKMLIKQKTNNNVHQLNIAHLAAGMYLLNITDNNKVVKTFKIQKVK